ncbi:hypothetical protein [Microbulbifer sp. SA54]|uniref:hypothetical protein n=1 Tax=Microbulbifer sp. SA54 TaxID=3401577 RepID=UPI003AAF6A13
MNLGNTPQFDDFVNDAIENQIKTLSPTRDYFSNFSFYRLDLDDDESFECRGTGGSLSGSGFTCNEDQIHDAIMQQCNVSDIYGIIKIVVTESIYGGSGGEIIFIGEGPQFSESQQLDAWRNTAIHELGHNVGLADLYGGGIRFNGDPVTGWPSTLSREWYNLDGPGCGKWCNSYKPVSEYTQSTTAACHRLTTKEECITFNRLEDGDCKADNTESFYECCSWSDDSIDDYFESRCTPAWGMENIGHDCLDGTGCYYGGAYGNNSWRPAYSWSDSIMYGPQQSDSFDGASERAFKEVLRCCATSDDAIENCADFRKEFSDFLEDFQPFKRRVGSCGVSQ